MSREDNKIWQRWRKKHENEFTRVFYNVRVGGGSPPAEGMNPDDLLDWLMLTMCRIDAVVETAEHVLIIEVRPEARRSLFGALMVYKQLWGADPKIDKPFYALGVIDDATTQIISIFELNNLRIEGV